ncbi:MAG TPA: GNAT family N-acetyltransferase [Syntrophales bacterium]|nr:GNAT family N-acetyltransferase [Syntrophales bacterium]
MGDMVKMFNPGTIALIGASGTEGSIGAALLKNLLASQGRTIFAVNRNRQSIHDVVCHASIADVPERVDLAVIATPAPTVPQIVEECGKAGVGGLVIVSQGFREMGADRGRLEAEIAEIRKRYGMRILGPNCLGFIRPNLGLNVSFLQDVPEMGKIAFITQSAAFGKTLLDWGISAHVGFSMFVSLGSTLDVDFGEMIDFLGNDPYTRSIVIYMEDTLGDVKNFASAARGFARNKPIVMLKPPHLAAPAQKGLSHTGMLAGPDEVFNAVLRRVGVVGVKEPQDLFNLASVLCSKNHPKGPRLAIITNASGVGIMAASRLLRSGGSLAEFSAETVKALDAVMPPYWKRENPVDVFRGADVARYEKVIRICMDDAGTDGILVIFTPQEAARSGELAEMIRSVAADDRKHLITTWLGGNEVREGREILIRNGIPAYETAEDAVRTYLYMWNYERNLQLQYETPSEIRIDEGPPKNHLKALIRKASREGSFVLAEEETRKFLVNYGIPTIKTHTTFDAGEAAAAADEFGYPVVIKVDSPDIIFRPDVGGIVTGITSEAELKDEYVKLLERVRKLSPQSAITGITVQKMIEMIDYELILGAKKDKDFGTVILFGMGGIGVQIFRDFSVGLPPLNQTLARRLMEETGVYRMLQGYRGKAPADLRQLEQILVSFSNLIVDFPEILEMDVNPIAISNGRACALDARIILDQNALSPAAAYSHLVMTPYPTRLIVPWRLPDGTEVLLRPIRPEDEPLQHEMLSTLSEHSLRARFFQTIKSITHEMHIRLCNIDYNREMAIVAEIKQNEKKRFIGIVRLIIEPDFKKGEFAVIVHDDFQGKGLAYKLLDMVIGIAQEKGLEEFYGYIQPGNQKMLKACSRLGMTGEKIPDGLIRMKLSLK